MNPVLVEAWRGDVVESFHRGALAVVDADGAAVLSIGDIERPVFPRSAVKALQALPLVETGAADRFGLVDEELALACASHGGEEEHVRAAASMLAKAGLDETVLECGIHWPGNESASRALAGRGGGPGPLHNNYEGFRRSSLMTYTGSRCGRFEVIVVHVVPKSVVFRTYGLKLALRWPSNDT
jgi:L-asparaginase II